MKKISISLFALILCFSLVSCGNKVTQVTNVEMTVKGFDGTEFTGVYSGDTIRKKANGSGIFDANEWTYKGNFVDNSLSGKGTVTNYPVELLNIDETSGGTYTGEIEDGKAINTGIFTNVQISICLYDSIYREGTYNGEVVDGIAHGEGTFESENSEGTKYTYKGEFQNGIMNGYGIATFEDGTILKGNYVNGEFKPTGLELIELYAIYSFGEFDIPEDTKNYINSHEYLFPNTDNNSYDSIELGEYNYKKYEKNISGCTEHIVKYRGEVLQIFESSLYGYTITAALVIDDDNNCTVVYLLDEVDVYEDDDVTIYGIPAAVCSFENISGGVTNCIAIIGSSIKK